MSISCRMLNYVFRPNIKKLSNHRNYSSDFNQADIPKYIPRAPTDILRALANTVGKDPTAAHYKFHDDPYLLPHSNPTKRSYSLSQEAGRKAAQWIRQQHSELFQHKEAFPMIEAYTPKPVYNDESNVNEEILRNVIHSACVTDAVTIYEILKKKNIEISNSTKQCLLELLCFYNNQDSMSEEWVEERWVKQSKKGREKSRNNWRGCSTIDELFTELIDTDHKSAAYCTLISGMFTHGQLDEGWKLYEDAKNNKIALNVETYNAILAKIINLRESHNLVMELAQNLVSEMNNNGIAPNFKTLNALMFTVSNMATNRNVKQWSLAVLKEFQQLGIEPTLATYHHLINSFSRNREEIGGVILSVLDNLEKTKMEIRDEDDILFFYRTMEIICNFLQNKELAYRLNDLLHSGDNYNFIGDNFKESVYYRYFFTVLCKTEPLDDFLEIYYKLVPNVYIPEPSVMTEILEAIRVQVGWEHLPKIWSDIMMFEQSDRLQVMEKTLEIAVECQDSHLHEAMANMGWTIWEKVESSQEMRIPIQWTGPLLGHILTLLLKCNDLSKAHLVVDKLSRSENILGEPNIESIQTYVQHCIENSSIDPAIKCIKYCNSQGLPEAESLAIKLNSSLKLSSNQLERLASIVGEACLQKETK